MMKVTVKIQSGGDSVNVESDSKPEGTPSGKPCPTHNPIPGSHHRQTTGGVKK